MYATTFLRKASFGGAIAALMLAIGCGDSKVTNGSTSTGGEAGTTGSSSGMGGSGGDNVGGAGGNMGGSGGGTGGNMGGFGGAGGNMGGSGGAGGEVPLPPCQPGNDIVLAMDRIFIGDTDPDGTPNPTGGWKQYGFDLDNRISTKTSTDLCQVVAGGSKAAVYPDGNGGIDNSFGKNILPIFLGLTPDLSTVLNESMALGEFTYLMSLSDVGQAACTTSGSFFLGSALGKVPLWDGTDAWPIDSSSLTDPIDPTSAKCHYPETKIVLGLVRTGPPSQFDLLLRFSGIEVKLPIREARMQFQLGPDQQSVSGGRIGGIIRTEELITEIAKIMGAVDASFCDPNSPTLVSILHQMRQASDIMVDGTQDPMKVCDGISIGLGFTMKAAKLGNVVPPKPPTLPCP